jgi:hypothetical protein
LLDEVNEERFDGLLKITEPEEGYFLALIDDYNSLIEIWVRDLSEDNDPEYESYGAKIEIRHGHRLQLSWYTDLFISHWITGKLDGQIADEADGVKETAYFCEKYPRLKDYNRGYYSNLVGFPWNRLLAFMRVEKKQCGKELWRLL